MDSLLDCGLQLEEFKASCIFGVLSVVAVVVRGVYFVVVGSKDYLGCRPIGPVMVLAVFLSTAVSPSSAGAQTTIPKDRVEATPKGTVGLGMVGAELGFIVPSTVGFTKTWAMVTFPAIGGAGGAVAGYFLLDKPGHEKASVAAMVVGVAGIIPAVLLSIRGIRREQNSKVASGVRANRSKKRELSMRDLAEAGPGLLRRSRSGLRVAMPGVSVFPSGVHDEGVGRTGPSPNRANVWLCVASGVF